MLKNFSEEKFFLTHFAIVIPKQKVVRSNRIWVIAHFGWAIYVVEFIDEKAAGGFC
jgi:hypothetical protein